MAHASKSGALPRNKHGDKPGHFPSAKALGSTASAPTKDAYRATVRQSGGFVTGNIYGYQGDYAKGYHHRFASGSKPKSVPKATVFDRGTTDARKLTAKGKAHDASVVSATLNSLPEIVADTKPIPAGRKTVMIGLVAKMQVLK